MKYYMIVHKLSGHHMPQIRNGQSFIQFHLGLYAHRPPRLWFTLRAARSWLTTYCKGEFVRKFIEVEYGTEFDGFAFAKGTQRNRADYKIIEVQLSSNGIEL
jgi:hypothetical protein